MSQEIGSLFYNVKQVNPTTSHPYVYISFPIIMRLFFSGRKVFHAIKDK